MMNIVSPPMIDCVINIDTDSHFAQYYSAAGCTAAIQHFYCIIPSLHSTTTE